MPVQSPLAPEYLASLQKALQRPTSLAHSLPGPSDLAFHRSIDGKLAAKLDDVNSRLLTVLRGLIGLVDEEGERKHAREEEGILDDWANDWGDGVDRLLERADTSLDEFLGKRRAPSIPIIPTETARTKVSSINTSGKPSPATTRLPTALTNASIPKTQQTFSTLPDNANDPGRVYKIYSSTTTPDFIKHQAQVPLSYVAPPVAVQPGDNDDESSSLLPKAPPHPYDYELSHIPYPASILQPTPKTVVAPRSFEETPFTLVTTVPQFRKLVATLEKASHVAIDLEHHSYRSFGGFLCLMQVSTRGEDGRGEDWVVDLCIPAIRDVMREMGTVLSDPSIVKVFHGAESDIVWLQQDFDLYVVNLFDTYHATKLLEFPSHSLASLLSLYCDFTADKRYQMADWRVRPLPEEMLHYARSDTHFLLFIYDNLVNALISRSPRPSPSPDASALTNPVTTTTTPSLLLEVLRRSEETCRRRYAREAYDAANGLGSQGYRNLAKKWGRLSILDGPLPAGSPARLEGAVLKAVHGWRDRVAREEDESTRFVLPNNQILTLAAKRPTSGRALALVCQPMTSVVRDRADELVQVVVKAMESVELETAAGPAAMTVDGEGERSESREEKRQRELREKRDLEGKKSTIVAEVWTAFDLAPAGSETPIVTSSSSMFGSSLPSSASAAPSSSNIALTSSLFGGSSPAFTASTTTNATNAIAGPSKDRRSFLEALNRINLSIQPSHPPPSAAASEGMDEAVLPGPEQVPFVPASARQTPASASSPAIAATAKATTATVIPSKSEIVTVGQPRVKKRKRDKAAAAAASAAEADGAGVEVGDAVEEEPSPPKKGKGKAAKDAAEEDGGEATVKSFDYASVPNGLDPVKGAVAKASKSISVQKQRKPKKANIEYGDFKRPPQNMAEPKKGNRAQTFKS